VLSFLKTVIPGEGNVLSTSNGTINLKTAARDEIIDITGKVREIVSRSGVKQGLVCVFVVGSTAAVTTVEHEPGLVADMHDAMERLYPRNMDYEHHQRWGDGNGHSHIRASFVGPSLTVPIVDGEMQLGTWQQVVFMEFDVKPRSRDIAVQIVGET